MKKAVEHSASPVGARSRWRASLVGLAAGLVASGCGLHLSTMLTSTYRIPSGYSETYRDRLDEYEGHMRRPVVVDPRLNEPPPKTPIRLKSAPDRNGADENGGTPDPSRGATPPLYPPPPAPGDRNGAGSP